MDFYFIFFIFFIYFFLWKKKYYFFIILFYFFIFFYFIFFYFFSPERFLEELAFLKISVLGSTCLDKFLRLPKVWSEVTDFQIAKSLDGSNSSSKSEICFSLNSKLSSLRCFFFGIRPLINGLKEWYIEPPRVINSDFSGHFHPLCSDK